MKRPLVAAGTALVASLGIMPLALAGTTTLDSERSVSTYEDETNTMCVKALSNGTSIRVQPRSGFSGPSLELGVLAQGESACLQLTNVVEETPYYLTVIVAEQTASSAATQPFTT